MNNESFKLKALCLFHKDGKILVKDELSTEFTAVNVLAEDPAADIIILEALEGRSGINIANSMQRTELLYTYTHGYGYETYKTEGSFIDFDILEVPLFMIDETHQCDTSKSKYIVVEMPLFFSTVSVCALHETTTVTDALIVPGSSGGAVVNKYGELVGIVSAGNNLFGYLVTLEDIQDFIEQLQKADKI